MKRSDIVDGLSLIGATACFFVAIVFVACAAFLIGVMGLLLRFFPIVLAVIVAALLWKYVVAVPVLP